MTHIYHGYGGEEITVKSFFFSKAGDFNGELKNSDQAILAVRGSMVVGGILLRGNKIIHRVGSSYVQRKLVREFRKN